MRDSRWYVVQTQPHSERKASFHLVRQGFQTYLPQYLKRRRHARRTETVPAPLFPRYLFVLFDIATQSWRPIRSTIGVNHLVCQGEQRFRITASDQLRHGLWVADVERLDADIAVPVARVVPISPLAELGPLIATGMNGTLKLDQAEAATESPARHALRDGVTAHVWVGAEERPAFLMQARLLSEEWSCPWTADPGQHHFSVLDALADPDSRLCKVLLEGL